MLLKFMAGIEHAMKDYSVERLNKIYDMAMDAEQRLVYPEVDISVRADFFLLACGYGNHDGYDVANQLYHAYDGIRMGLYTENELINAVKKRLTARKICV